MTTLQTNSRVAQWISLSQLRCSALLLVVALAGCARIGVAENGKGANGPGTFPWMNAHLSPDQRADLVLRRTTLDEKLQMVHGLVVKWGPYRGVPQSPSPYALGGDGFV